MSSGRGCVFYNFGTLYISRLCVALYSLRQVYQGPVTIFLIKDHDQESLARELSVRLNIDIAWFVMPQGATKHDTKHLLFELSPYETTLLFDSDLLFTKSFDELWAPLEEKGILLTRFYPDPYGIDGSPVKPGTFYRIGHLNDIKHLLTETEYRRALKGLAEESTDVNVGIMGYRNGRGNSFLFDWGERIKKGRGIMLIEEMLALALSYKYPHHLAEEKWNCPADEYFRRTNLADACVIHYFADGGIVDGRHITGRNSQTWASDKWFAKYEEMSKTINTTYWDKFDPVLIHKRKVEKIRKYIPSIVIKRLRWHLW